MQPTTRTQNLTMRRAILYVSLNRIKISLHVCSVGLSFQLSMRSLRSVSLGSLSVCFLSGLYSWQLLCHSVPEGIISICSNDGAADHFSISSRFSSPLSLPVCMTLPPVESARLQSCDIYLSKKAFC